MKILLVTGASSDYGTALLRHIVCRYDLVWAHYRQMNDALMELYQASPEKIRLVQADFLKRQDVEAMARIIFESRQIPNHIVHFPADKYTLSHFHSTEWEVYERNLSISVRSAVLLLQRLIPGMIKAGDGRIVFMLSDCTCNSPPACTAHYTMIKYALLGLVKTLSAEYGKKGIMINGVSPGMMETRFLDELPGFVREKNAKERASGKNIEVKELLDVFDLLLFGGCRITGQNIAVEAL